MAFDVPDEGNKTTGMRTEKETIIDFDAAEGEWFYFFSSRINPVTGLVEYDDPASDARVQLRSMGLFFEERLKGRKKLVEHVLNAKTRQMERIEYYPTLAFEEAMKERDDAYDYAITGLENFKDKSGSIISCTRENKLKLMKVPVFDRFIARCLELLANAGVKQKEEIEKN
jgi:hypothetical protein